MPSLPTCAALSCHLVKHVKASVFPTFFLWQKGVAMADCRTKMLSKLCVFFSCLLCGNGHCQNLLPQKRSLEFRTIFSDG